MENIKDSLKIKIIISCILIISQLVLLCLIFQSYNIILVYSNNIPCWIGFYWACMILSIFSIYNGCKGINEVSNSLKENNFTNLKIQSYFNTQAFYMLLTFIQFMLVLIFTVISK